MDIKKDRWSRGKKNPAILNNKKIKITQDKRYVPPADFQRQLSGERVPLTPGEPPPRFFQNASPAHRSALSPARSQSRFCKKFESDGKGYLFSFQEIKMRVTHDTLSFASKGHLDCFAFLTRTPKEKSTLNK